MGEFLLLPTAPLRLDVWRTKDTKADENKSEIDAVVISERTQAAHLICPVVMNSALSAAFSSAKQSDGEFSFRADVTRTLKPRVSSYRSGIASEIRRTLKNFVLVH